MRSRLVPAALVAFGLLSPAPVRGVAGVTVTVRNPLGIARPAETIELSLAALKPSLTFTDAHTLHVTDGASGADLVTQVLDADGNGDADTLIFQANLAPNESRTFSVSTGARRQLSKDDFKAYGRLVHERYDDYAWENDRVAFRIYGAALESAPGEMLTSSGIDVWAKRTRRLVINDWYMVDDYHRDAGEGADFYNVGDSRGCGGSGLWNDGTLAVASNFRDVKTLANGPIRVLFEARYPVWDLAGVSTTTRISLDAGQSLNRVETRTYSVRSVPARPAVVGIKHAANADVATRRDLGVARSWEPLATGHGALGCGVVIAPSAIRDVRRVGSNELLFVNESNGPLTYWVGAGWDQSGDFATVAAWDAYLEACAIRTRTPIVVTIRP